MPRKELISKIEYLGFRFWLAGFKLIPAGLAKRVLIGLLLAVGYGLGIRKKVALQQLDRVYPQMPSSQKKDILKKLYRSMALTIQEVYLCSDEQLFSSSRITGKQYVDEALALGRGAILATAHFGNWEAARILPKAGIPLSVITKTQRNKRFDAYTKAIRERCGVKTIDMSRGLRDIVHQLNEGRIIAILMDQNAGKNGLIMDFLGYPASHWKGVAKLSLRYQIPIVPGFAKREADDSLNFVFMPFILPDNLEDKDENYSIVLQQVNTIIEQWIHRWPEQWFWVHKRWKHCFNMFS